ncbi:MAG: LacI family DNA-binding transcriptional regulator [bacterium]
MRPVTLHDLARRCDCSIATVSAVVNGADWVSTPTRTRIQDAIKEMGYHPNRLARGLQRREGHSVGVIVSDLTNPFFTQIVRSLSHSLLAAGRALSLCDSDHRHDLGEKNLRMLLEGQIAGLVLIGDSVPERTLRMFVHHRALLPVIAIEREYNMPQVSCLLVDSEQGAFTATRHLIDQGRTRIAMIAGPASGASSATYGRVQRYDGYCRALAESGREMDSRLVVEGTWRFPSGQHAMRQLLALDPPPDAVFAANDMMAFGAMSVARDAGVHVPDDIALIGFDDVPMAALTSPSLTTMAMPMTELGVEAARLLEVQLRLAPYHTPVREVLATRLVVRESSLSS